AGRHDPARGPDRGSGQRPGRRHRHPPRADGRRRDLPGDRAVPADRAGGGVTSQQPGPAARAGVNSAGASSNGAGGSGAVERATPKRGLGPDRATVGRGPAAFLSGRSTEKSLDFRGSSKRLLRDMAPERLLAAGALLLAVVNIALTVTGPRLLGEATNIIFTGVIS